MGATLLSLVSDAQAELGLFPLPVTIVSAQDDQTQQMLALMQRLGAMLMQRRDWTGLDSEAVVNIVTPIITTGNLTQGSAVITGIPSTSGLVAGNFTVKAPDAPVASRLLSVDSATQVTMTEEAGASQSGATLTFSQDTFALPADFRHFINRTQWDRTMHWELRGPISPQEWQWEVSGIVSTGPRRRFRVIGGAARVWPAPSSTDSPATLSYEYVSSFWARSASGTPQARFLADTDTCVFPDDCMITGLKALLWQIKGFDAGALTAAHETAVRTAMAQDGGAKTLDLAGRLFPELITTGNVPDGNWGIP